MSDKLRQALKDEPKKRLDEIYPRAKYGDFGRSLYIEGHASTHELIVSLVDALREIAKKVPYKVSKEEAADMACEFQIVASEALEKLRKELGMG